MLRPVLAACIAATALLSAPAMAEAPARCEATSLRVYFAQGQTALDDTTMRMLELAGRNMADCDYAELHVVLDGASPQARQRGAAIMAALDEDDWDVARIEQRAPTQRVSYAPAFVEVVMSPSPLRMGEPTGNPNAGV